MEKIGDILKQIVGETSQVKRVLGTTTCKCGVEVTIVEDFIIGGPEKGKPFTYHVGCKCQEIKLAQETLVIKERDRTNHNFKKFTENSFINASLRHANFENYHPKSKKFYDAKENLMRFAQSFTKGCDTNLIIRGSYGTGKSHLSIAVTKVLIKRGFSCAFISSPKFISKIQESFNRDSTFTESELLDYLRAVDLLVIDDLGAEYHSRKRPDEESWASTKLFEVIDDRAGKSTIFTTNLTDDVLAEKIGGRNVSRISGYEIEMVGPDYRKVAR